MPDCRLCPRQCGAARAVSAGVCHMGSAVRVARAAPHYGEEPCISGERGSGAVFFAGCPLGCVYCQNYALSRGRIGETVSVERLAAIFAGHHTLLDDDDLFDAANDRLLTEQCTAEWAWHQVLMELSQQYRQLDDPYLQARYIDIEDILQRTLRHLQGVQERVPTPGEPTIIIADNIYPSTVLQLDASFVKGLCLRDGSEQAHGAIIARAAGIAWLSQQGEALNSVQPGETIVLDMRHQRLIRD